MNFVSTNALLLLVCEVNFIPMNALLLLVCVFNFVLLRAFGAKREVSVGESLNENDLG